MKNLGLNLDKEEKEIQGDEWTFGATSPDCIYAVPLEVRDQYLPFGELQKGRGDFMDCATRDPINQLETKFNYAYRNNLIKPENRTWLEMQGYRVFHDDVPYIEFSDRFNAIKSGTDENGNSMKAPRESIRKDGLIPKKLLPANSEMRFEDYHNAKDITKEMEDLGHEFLKRWAINYEQYTFADLKAVLERDLVGLAGHAWSRPKNGVYPRTEAKIGHAFMGFGLPVVRIFDNYLDDGKKGDWIKQLAPDYRFYHYGYRTFIRQESIPSERNSLIDYLYQLWQTIFDKGETPVVTLPPKPLPINMREKLLKLATDSLGTNVRSGTAPQDLGCADALTSVLAKLFPFNNEVSTARLNRLLSKDARFSRTLDLTPGNIIISPTNGDSIGHCGVILKGDKIASNNSNTGLWDDHFSIKSWVERYRTLLKLPVYVYKIK